MSLLLLLLVGCVIEREHYVEIADETWADGVTDNGCDGEREVVQTEFGADAIVGESDGAYAGNQVLARSDLDGDGLGDILVAADKDASRYALGGAAYLGSDPHEGSLGDYPARRRGKRAGRPP